MSGWQKCFQGLWVLFLLVVGAIALSTGIRSRTTTVEIVSYQAAVKSQSKAQALNFISTFSSSHLVGDLIVSLKPEVAKQVCADLQGRGPPKTRIACVLRETLTVQRSATATKTGPAADIAMVNPVSSGAVTSVASNDEPRDRQDVVSTARAGGPYAFHPPVAATAPTEAIAAVAPASAAVTSVASNDEPRDRQEVVSTARAGGPYAFHPRVAATAPTEAIAAVAPASAAVTSVASNDEPRDGQEVVSTARAGGPYAFHPPVAATAPTEAIAAVAPASAAVTSVASNDEPRDGQEVVSTARAGGPYAFHPRVAATAPTEAIAAVAPAAAP